jgi:hypothetical protein
MSHHRRRPLRVVSRKTRWQRGSAQRRTRQRPAAARHEPGEHEAHAAAAKGTEAFRAWFKANPSKRDAVKPIMATLQAACQDADQAVQGDDPFGLPPIVDTADGLNQDLPTPEQLRAAEQAARESASAMEREAAE